MCGILFVLNPPKQLQFAKRLDLLKRRGPDEYNIQIGDKYIIGHTRLCITNPMHGQQPMESDDWIVVHNGEIYNELDSTYIMHSLKKNGPHKTPILLDGIFAYCAYNTRTGEMYAARDSVGVIPLYWALDGDTIWVASEMKALYGLRPQIVPPGYILNQHGNLECFKVEYPQQLPTSKHTRGYMLSLLRASVKKRMNLDVPWGVLLSGGLDSSIIATLIDDNMDDCDVSWRGMHTFSCGLKDSPDLQYARELAMYFPGNKHHEFIFTEQQGIDALREVIYAIESYDVTTVRASVPMYLLGQYVAKCGVKVLFSGEGADELFGGYLYNRWCPSPEEMHAECITKMERLHLHDCLRANKSLACHGIECRVPFLDKNVVNYAMRVLDPSEKITIPTKRLLRKEFELYLPKNVIERQKEQFSDGVGNKWIDALKIHAKNIYPDISNAAKQYPFQTPKTQEAYLYRCIFNELFGEKAEETVFYSDDTCACSSERGRTWNKEFSNDPSAKQIKYL